MPRAAATSDDSARRRPRTQPQHTHPSIPRAHNLHRCRCDRPAPPPLATPSPVAEATPTPEVTRAELEKGLSRYLPADVPDPYADLGDEGLSARLLFLLGGFTANQ